MSDNEQMPTEAEVFDHDGSAMFPSGITKGCMVEVKGDEGPWSEPVRAGALDWRNSVDIPIRLWRRARSTKAGEVTVTQALDAVRASYEADDDDEGVFDRALLAAYRAGEARGEQRGIERAAEVVSKLRHWQGSNDLADGQTKEWAAAAIRALPTTQPEGEKP